MMKTQCRSSDMISSLPENIIETILSLMPIRDALRTSILSKRWRHCWMTMPKLVFDDNLVRPIKRLVKSKGLVKSKRLVKSKILNAIFHVLLMHSGPTILKFELDLNMEAEFDQIILCLSKKIIVKDLIINTLHTFYKQPSSFFSLQGLESLELINCEFEPPVTFNGFNKLTNLSFINVTISNEALQHLLSNCPLLKTISLIDYDEVCVEEMSFNFVKLFQCVPLIYKIDISMYCMKYLVAGGMPNKLPTSLHLKYVRLDVCLREQDIISAVLCIIRSSPNLEKLSFMMYDNKELPIKESSIKFDDLHDDLSLTLDHLKHFEILNFNDNMIEMEFVKLIMAKSPILKIARIELRDFVSVVQELKILRDMIYLPRASPSAKVIVERQKTYADRLKFC